MTATTEQHSHCREDTPRAAGVPRNSGIADWLAVLPVVLLALIWRLRTLDAMSMWCDELRQVSAYYLDGFRQVMYYAARQSQPPLDYWIGHIVFKFSQSDFAARLPDAVFGTLFVLCSFFLARKVLSRPMALLVALGLACSPYGIHYSQEARPYTIFWFFLMLTLLALSRAWARNLWRDWALFLPIVFLCLLTRTVEPVIMTGSMALWGLAQLRREFQRDRATFRRKLSSFPASRLGICLITAWIPAAYVITFVLRSNRSTGFIAQKMDSALGGQSFVAALQRVAESLVRTTLPVSWVLLPLGVVGVALFLRSRSGQLAPEQRIVLVPVAVGFVIHLLVHVFIYSRLVEFVPKYVYWAYTLPFLFIGAGYALQHFLERWRARSQARFPLRIGWVCVAVALLLQLRVDHAAAILQKPDWRGAIRKIVESGIRTDHDVVFCGEAGSEFGRGMVFRVSPHYWPTDEHTFNLLRDRNMLFNDGRPILDRTNCRVALLARCAPGRDTLESGRRLSAGSRALFEFFGSHQFFALVSRAPYAKADDALEELGRALVEMLGETNPLVVDVYAAQAWVLAKRGQYALADRHLWRTRSLVPHAKTALFDRRYGKLFAYLKEAEDRKAQLMSYPGD